MSRLRLCLVCSCFVLAQGHGSLVTPRPRNSIDYLVNVNEQWCANITGDACHNGQASFWYSQGCFIGCPSCDHLSGRRQTDLCRLGKNPTNNGIGRSLNRNATPLALNDIYQHNPWRAPGSAPVGDACGFAGGTPWEKDVAEEGVYKKTIFAHHGMKGTDLPKMPTGTVWKLGGEGTVSWNVRNNHGGGYQYRLCPVSEVLTEECFQKYPLEFVQDKHAIVFANGTSALIEGTFINEGTLPEGSTWAMLPIPATGLGPRCLPGPNDTNSTPHGCMEWEGRSNHNGHVDGPCVPCPETPGSDCSRCSNPGWPGGEKPAFLPPLPGVMEAPLAGVLDVVKIPRNLPPGEYVLGWRYDCEGTAQVWSNCADITLVEASSFINV